MINKHIILKRGFTLIETMVAILVLMTAIVGPLVIASKGLQATTLAKDQDTAFYLAQDAVEYVRWVRDTDALQGNADWLAGLDGTSNGFVTIDGQNNDCTGSAGCYIDSIKNTINSCGGVYSTCPVIGYDPTNDYFSYNTGSPTIFTRTIQIQQGFSGNPDEAAVTVKISWCDQAAVCSVTPRSVVVREDLFNWH